MIVADLHIHSKYSSASSSDIDIPNIYNFMKKKGITLIGTGGFTHRSWLKQLKHELKPCRRFPGILCYKDDGYFILQSEFSTVDKYNGKLRKINHVVLVPSFDIAEQINDSLAKFQTTNNKDPSVLKCSSSEFVESLMEISNRVFVFPADIQSSFFDVLKSNQEYAPLNEIYKDTIEHIQAFETGVSDISRMKWMVSVLNKFTPLSNSNARFLKDIGKEANIFNLRSFSYDNLIDAIKTRKGFIRILKSIDETSPSRTKKKTNNLMNKSISRTTENPIPFSYFVPLKKVISRVLSKGENTILVKQYYDKIISYFGNEVNVYLSSDDSVLISLNPKLAKAIRKIKDKGIF